MSDQIYAQRPELDLQTAALKVPPHSIEAEQAVLGGVMLTIPPGSGCPSWSASRTSTAMTIG